MLLRVIFILFTISLVACDPLEREEITPVAKVQTLADVLGTGTTPAIDLVFKFEDIDVAPPVRRLPIPILGTVVRELGNTFAELFILLNTDWSVDQEPLILDLPAFDAETLHSLELSSLDLKIVPGSVRESKNPLVNLWHTITFKRANLKFLKSMTIYVANEEMYANGEWARVASYSAKAQGMACEEKCLNFDTKLGRKNPINFARILKDGGRLYVRPEVEVKATPKRAFNLAGEIRLRVTLNSLF